MAITKILLINNLDKIKSKGKLNKQLEKTEVGTKIYQILWAKRKAVLTGKFVAINTYI